MASITVNYTIAYGSSLRIGYRPASSSVPYTYLTTYPSYNDSPYTFDGIPLGIYEVELTTICPNCSGGVYSNPVVVQAISV